MVSIFHQILHPIWGFFWTRIFLVSPAGAAGCGAEHMDVISCLAFPETPETVLHPQVIYFLCSYFECIRASVHSNTNINIIYKINCFRTAQLQRKDFHLKLHVLQSTSLKTTKNCQIFKIASTFFLCFLLVCKGFKKFCSDRNPLFRLD